MSGIYSVSCTVCSFGVRECEHIQYIVTNDGDEIVCTEPSGTSQIEAIAGCSISTLKREGRLAFRCCLFCLECGHVDFYDTGGTPSYTLATAQVKKYKCNSCGESRLYPIAGYRGCLYTLLQLTGLKKRVKCPKCKGGKLRHDLYMIS